MKRIVVLDADPALGSAAHPADPQLSTRELAELGELTIKTGTRPDQVLAQLQGADIAVTNKVVLSREHFEQLPQLKLISILATGVNVVDLDAATDHGITVCNVPGYSTASTAQHTFALLLELCHHVGSHAASVRAGKWAESPSFSYFETDLLELDGLTMGIVGYGAIGERVASSALAFGMRVLVHTRTPKDDARVSFVDKETLLRRSDIVSLHCPLTQETHHFIDAEALSIMRPEAFLLNCSRGPVIDENAVCASLMSGKLRGAGLDVLSSEPPGKDHPLLTAPNCIVTPHIAWASSAARRRLLSATAENVRLFLSGTPQNVVNG